MNFQVEGKVELPIGREVRVYPLEDILQMEGKELKYFIVPIMHQEYTGPDKGYDRTAYNEDDRQKTIFENKGNYEVVRAFSPGMAKSLIEVAMFVKEAGYTKKEKVYGFFTGMPTMVSENLRETKVETYEKIWLTSHRPGIATGKEIAEHYTAQNFKQLMKSLKSLFNLEVTPNIILDVDVDKRRNIIDKAYTEGKPYKVGRDSMWIPNEKVLDDSSYWSLTFNGWIDDQGRITEFVETELSGSEEDATKKSQAVVDMYLDYIGHDLRKKERVELWELTEEEKSSQQNWCLEL